MTVGVEGTRSGAATRTRLTLAVCQWLILAGLLIAGLTFWPADL